MKIHGVGDCSEFDTFVGRTNWKTSDMGCEFAVVRATTTGTWNSVTQKPNLRQDAMFAWNAAQIDMYGLERYTYMWYDPRVQLSGVEQANFYLDAISKVPKGFGHRPVLDVEGSGTIAYSAGSLTQLRFCAETIQKATGVMPAIYSYPGGIETYSILADISWMRNYPLMIAHWGVLVPKCPWPWYPGAEFMWQYTDQMPGARYGFFSKSTAYPAPKICMAVKNN